MTYHKDNRNRKPPVLGALPRSLTDSFRTSLATAFEDLCNDLVPNTPSYYKARYQTEMFQSKYSDPSPAGAKLRATAAINKWLAVESRNERTNLRLLVDEVTFRGGFTSNDVVELARKYISDCIGMETPEDLISYGEFTNGASTGVRRGPNTVSQKYVGEANASVNAWWQFEQLVLSCPGYYQIRYDSSPERLDNAWREVDWSEMFTVPKNSEIDRVACKEPEINMFCQRAAGNFIRSRLLRVGVNLNDQSINQRLARRGSLLRSDPEFLDLATIDLSSASDSVTIQLVAELLPPSWFAYLDCVRCSHVVMPEDFDPSDDPTAQKSVVGGKCMHEMSMFSSMGNGFTFELESLIFWALARAFTTLTGIRGRISVFGDDIIIPREAAPRFAKVLNWFGFKVNTEKSCWDRKGFRESCGAHWKRGCDVTPFFIREPMRHQRDLINQLNQLRDWITRGSFHGLWTYNQTAAGSYRSQLVDIYVAYSKRVWFDVRGGRDLEDNTCLVTPDSPKKRFSSRLKKIEVNPMGAYLQWLHTRERVLDARTSVVSLPGKVILVDNDSELGFNTAWLFLQELHGVDLRCE